MTEGIQYQSSRYGNDQLQGRKSLHSIVMHITSEGKNAHPTKQKGQGKREKGKERTT